MSQPQHTYSLRKEIGFGVEIALSIMGEPHEIQIEDQAGAYTLAVRTTTDPLASIRALSQWTAFSITPGVLTPVLAGVRKVAVEIVSINSDAPKATVFHMPGFFRGTESARYYGVDQLDSPGSIVGARLWDGASFNKHVGVISNVVDGRNGTVSFWFNKGGPAGQQFLFQLNDRLWIAFGDQVINLIVQKTGGGLPNQVVIGTGTTGWAADVWNHWMASWENTFPLSTANVTQYLNGVELIDSVDAVAGFAGSEDVDLGYAGSNIWQGTDDTETDNLEMCVSEFYLNLEERFDLTQAANREKFRSAGGDAVNIGGDGSGATGTQPAFYAANGELNPNAGKSDNLSTVVGAILDCADALPKV